jgi:soluble lytic murein transglycosylase
MGRFLLLFLFALLLALGACQDAPTPTLMSTAMPPIQNPAGEEDQRPTVMISPTPPPTFTPTLTPSPTPTPTPVPAALLEAAQRDQSNGRYDSAIEIYQKLMVAPDATDFEVRGALLGIAEVQLLDGSYADAEMNLLAFLEKYPEVPEVATVTFWLAEARQGLLDWTGSIEALEAYLALDDTLVLYISDMMADSYLALGDSAAAVAAYEAALTGTATTEKIVDIRERLAEAHMAAGAVDMALAQYDAISAISGDGEVLARMDYLSGYALILDGRAEEGLARYLHAVTNYPKAYDAYLALIELVDAGYPVDSFSRGLVDFYAGAHIPAISAFYNHIEADPTGHPADAHLYVARCYAALGNYSAAMTELDVLVDTHLGDPLWGSAWLERAKFQVEMGDWMGAIETYLELVDGYPADPAAPNALWRAAALWERHEVWDEAGLLFQRHTDDYPTHEDAAEALLQAGLMAWQAGELESAVEHWQRLADEYPDSEWVAPALLWLVRVLEFGEAPTYMAQAAALPPDSYYAIRAADLVSGVVPFEPPAGIFWPEDEGMGGKTAGQEEAEIWLAEWATSGENDEVDLATPSDVITQDPRWERGRKLWELNLIAPAREELNGLRWDLREDALASYQLALAFRDMGLYRSSILAASALIGLSPAETPLDVPPFVGRLAYPAYYRDLIEEATVDYGLDPLLLLAMIRQESLFESFARSWAAAQGLMQVIPSTGEYIADSLGWADYENDDLYKPYVSITFGAFYLAEQLERFDGKVHVALSAYNAGPGNASYWYEVAPEDPDFYLEVITLSEPRSYIQRIYTHYTYYRALYGEF